MSKISKEIKKTNKKTTENFMGGKSYKIDPLLTLKIVTASSIFGEPQYYRGGMQNKPSYLCRNFKEFELIPLNYEENTVNYMERIIDEALDYDFEKTIEFAVTLRNEFLVRLNPQVIMVRAALHPGRVKYNEQHPGKFRELQSMVMKRADEPSAQLSYYLYLNKDQKNNQSKIPSILKRSWADRLNKATPYEINKYKNAECGMINTIRLCHANSSVIDELMTNGKVETTLDVNTWENLRSKGYTWKQILTEIYHFPHMALLRNLRGIATELTEDDRELFKIVLDTLVKGAKNGKQYPYRYYTAYKMIEKSDVNFKTLILEALERCLNESLNNIPYIKGRTMVLSDNSGSAWGSLNSEYGTVKVAEIGNLSAVLTAMRSEEGYVGVFGNTLNIIPIKKTSSILDNLEEVNRKGREVGMATETGLWLFMEDIIKNRKHYDNLFVYSDMQAGHKGLFSDWKNGEKYKKFAKENFDDKTKISYYIDLVKLVNCYRKINPKFNVFSVQTAGYDNNILPQHMYRTEILTGWTGKEAVYADRMIKLWDELDEKNTKKEDNLGTPKQEVSGQKIHQ